MRNIHGEVHGTIGCHRSIACTQPLLQPSFFVSCSTGEGGGGVVLTKLGKLENSNLA